MISCNGSRQNGYLEQQGPVHTYPNHLDVILTVSFAALLYVNSFWQECVCELGFGLKLWNRKINQQHRFVEKFGPLVNSPSE